MTILSPTLPRFNIFSRLGTQDKTEPSSTAQDDKEPAAESVSLVGSTDSAERDDNSHNITSPQPSCHGFHDIKTFLLLACLLGIAHGE